MKKYINEVVAQVVRYKTILRNWAARYGLFLHAKLAVGFEFLGVIKRKLVMNIHAGFKVGAKAVMKYRARFRSFAKLGFGMKARVKAKYLLKSATGFAVGFASAIRKKNKMFFSAKWGAGFKAAIKRMRNFKHKSGFKVGFGASLRNMGRLIYIQKIIKTNTVGILKDMTYEEFSEKTIGTLKREVHTIPDFKVEFTAELQKQ